MQRTTTRTELLRPVFFTTNEVIAVGAAVTTYKKWLTRTPESTTEHQETLTLLDRFQQRLIQPGSYQLEASHERS